MKAIIVKEKKNFVIKFVNKKGQVVDSVCVETMQIDFDSFFQEGKRDAHKRDCRKNAE